MLRAHDEKKKNKVLPLTHDCSEVTATVLRSMKWLLLGVVCQRRLLDVLQE